MIGNTAGAITAGQLEARLGAIGEIGELFIKKSDAYSKAIPATTWTVINGVNAGVTRGAVTVDAVNGTLTFNKPGFYTGVFAMSFALNNGADVEGAVHIDGVLSEKSEFTRTIANPNDFGSAVTSSVVEVEVVDAPVVVDFRVFVSLARTILIENLDINIHGIS